MLFENFHKKIASDYLDYKKEYLNINSCIDYFNIYCKGRTSFLIHFKESYLL
jgi:hypothetical protein